MEDDVLKLAMGKIDNLVGIQCKILHQEVLLNNVTIDAEIEIEIESNNKKVKYFVETKKKIVPEQIKRIQEQMNGMEPFVLMADYITPKAKEILRYQNIPYVDTAGNMYFNIPGIYIYIETKKNNRQKLKTKTRAFKKAGLKVIFQFLQNPEYLNKPYRFIGKHAKVTIATVGNVIQDLLREKYIVQKNNKEYQFTDRQRLFEEWVREFNNNLRPNLNQKKFRWLTKNTDWRNIELPKNTFWGGENAAEILTQYNITEKEQIYTGLPFTEVMKELKIVPNENGEITLIEIFWDHEDKADKVVDPILIYADLLNDTNPRNMETANKIYKEYVQNTL